MRITWRYNLHGTVKHAVGVLDSSGVRTVAECGTSPAWFMDWYGSGTQNEHERLKELPVCKKCAKRGYVYREEDL